MKCRYSQGNKERKQKKGILSTIYKKVQIQRKSQGGSLSFGKNALLFILKCQATQVTPHVITTYPFPSGYMTALQLPFT